MTDIEDIIAKAISGQRLNQTDDHALNQWLEQPENQDRFREQLHIAALLKSSRAAKHTNVHQAWNRLTLKHRILRSAKYAAVAGLFITIGTLFYLNSINDTPSSHSNDGVLLTLSDGSQINLNKLKSEQITPSGGEVLRVSDRKLSYGTPPLHSGTSAQQFNRLQVPRNNSFEIELSDGTKIWINADSELTYPVTFDSLKREVTVIGEAYFEVAKDPSRPFFVRSGNSCIRVTGTKFNVRNYAHEDYSATLLEGGIELSCANHTVQLKPGEHAYLTSSGKLTVESVDAQRLVAWTQNLFYFKGHTLAYIMNELARWYDFEPIFESESLRALHFTGTFSRDASLDEIISLLQQTDKITLRMEKRKLIISD